MADPYVDPATGVLRNRLGISNPNELAVAEAGITTVELYRIERQGVPGRYDLKHVRAFHYEIFKAIYAWAGEIRTVEIGKGMWFCPARNIEPFAAGIFSRLAAERHLRGRRRVDFVARFAEYLGDVNALHPFREGNGRAQRAFFSQLAREAGYRVAWERLDGESNVQACWTSLSEGDQEPLRRLLDELVEPWAL